MNFSNVVIQQSQQVIGTYDDFDFDTTNVHAVVTGLIHTHAVINGDRIPGLDSPSFDVGCPILLVPTMSVMPDRTQWLNDPVYNQWTLDEIEQGSFKSLDICTLIKHNNIMKIDTQQNCEGLISLLTGIIIMPGSYNPRRLTTVLHLLIQDAKILKSICKAIIQRYCYD